MARTAKPSTPASLPPRLRRAYHECRYGQLHLHNAIPAGGGFDELTPVVCLHASGETGRVFVPLFAQLGQARSVYAPDLPGAGESDPAPGVAAVDAAVNVLVDFLDSMRIRSFDLVYRGDALVAVQRLLKTRDGAIRRVVQLGEGPQPGIGRVQVLPVARPDAPEVPGRLVEMLSRPA